eukprot:gene21162-28053_t
MASLQARGLHLLLFYSHSFWLVLRFYWHSLSHYIGLDVHDTSLLSHQRLLKVGFAITIEPGLYIPDEEQYGPYRGIGVRIEDDILLNQDGAEIMSAGIPTAIDEVEALVGNSL